jgi:hypothetical protein
VKRGSGKKFRTRPVEEAMPGRDVVFAPEDRRILKRILCALRDRVGGPDGGELLADLALRFQGAPYETAPLEGKGPGEPLVINLRSFDCFTFVESMTALALLVRTGETSGAAFAAILERLRYRRGIRRGWASRLHYFTDWLGDNARLGILRDVTAELGGIPDRRPVSYLTEHAESYPPLSDGATRREVRRRERNLSRRRRHILPTEHIGKSEPLFREGDILGIAAARPGLDVLHAGLAVRRSGRVHLLHASRPAGGVVVSEVPLSRYAADRADATGIVAARLNPGEVRPVRPERGTPAVRGRR